MVDLQSNPAREAGAAAPPLAGEVVLVRYGVIPEVARFRDGAGPQAQRQESVVVQTHRGLELGVVLERLRAAGNSPDADPPPERTVQRLASAADRQTAERQRVECQGDYHGWLARLEKWGVALELVDLERTLDGENLILYVLTDRGPETTKLAIQAAAAGIPITVQPIGPEGLVPIESPSHSCGCHDGGCGT